MENIIFKKLKKTVIYIAIFIVAGSLFIIITETKAEVGEEQRMENLWNRGEISDDEYYEWLDEYEESKEEGASGWRDFLADPLGAITSVFGAIGDYITNGISEWLADFWNLIDYKTVTRTALHPESEFSVFSVVYSGLYSLVLTLSLSLLILKTLLYGFNVYILWRNGSPEENPFEIIVRHLFAIGIMLSFQEIYTIVGNIAEEILNRINQIVSPGAGVNFVSVILNLLVGPGFLVAFIFIIVYFIEYVKAIITTAAKGIELFIFRIGAPLACVSATTPQAGVFNQYIMSIIKSILSIFIMVIALNLSITIINAKPNLTGLLWATASLKLVNRGSALLSQFTTAPNQGGGGGMGGMLLQAGRIALTTATTGSPK